MRYRLALALAAITIAVPLGACGGDNNDAARTPTPTPTPTPTDLPPEFVKCMEDQGFAVTSSDEIHAAPPDVLQRCFGTLHGG